MRWGSLTSFVAVGLSVHCGGGVVHRRSSLSSKGCTKIWRERKRLGRERERSGGKVNIWRELVERLAGK
jgi:hypothetical protein